MTESNHQPIPCPSWCLTDHTENEYHSRRTLGQPFGEVEALLMQRPGVDLQQWIYCRLTDPEHLLTVDEARAIAYALLQAAAILEA